MKNYYEIGEEFYAQEDYVSAVENYKKGADLNDADCINALAYCYEDGIGARR